MLYFLIALIALLLVIAVIYRDYESELVRKSCENKSLLKPLYPMGLRIYDWIISKYPSGNEKQLEWAQAVYVREDPRLKLRLYGARQMAIFWVCILLTAAFGAAALALPKGGEETTELARPEFGESESYTLNVEGVENESGQITVAVSGQEPDESGMNAVFDDAFESVKQQILGENSSLEEVRTDLKLPASTIYGIRTSWKSLSPEYIDSTGRIVANDLPEEGTIATLTVNMSYSMYESQYQIDIRLLGPKHDAEYLWGILKRTLEENDENSITDATLKLPGELEGKTLKYTVSKGSTLSALPILFIMIMMFTAVIGYQRQKEAYQIRNRQLEADYAGFVFELGIMLQCGMTIRSAWERMLREYEEQHRREGGEKRYLYEEMTVTRNQIAAGMNEGAAYAAFGRRCKSHCYLRLGGNLEQNLRQGIAGLSMMLDQELSQAIEQNKNRALQEGERLETKMLVPMMILLGLVMAILLIPAFMSM